MDFPANVCHVSRMCMCSAYTNHMHEILFQYSIFVSAVFHKFVLFPFNLFIYTLTVDWEGQILRFQRQLYVHRYMAEHDRYTKEV